jgi:hypothetical protein
VRATSSCDSSSADAAIEGIGGGTLRLVGAKGAATGSAGFVMDGWFPSAERLKPAPVSHRQFSD